MIPGVIKMWDGIRLLLVSPSLCKESHSNMSPFTSYQLVKFLHFISVIRRKKPIFGEIFKNFKPFRNDCMAVVWIVFNFSNVSIFMYSNNIFHRVLCLIDVFWGVLWSPLTTRQWYNQFKPKHFFVNVSHLMCVQFLYKST